MSKLVKMIGGTLGSGIGWAIGAKFGFFAAFMVSIVGTGAGVYLAIRVVQEYDL